MPGENQHIVRDAKSLERIIERRGTKWVLAYLDHCVVVASVMECCGWEYELPLARIFGQLEEEGYPSRIIALLQDNESQPWLTPTPSGG